MAHLARDRPAGVLTGHAKLWPAQDSDQSKVSLSDEADTVIDSRLHPLLLKECCRALQPQTTTSSRYTVEESVHDCITVRVSGSFDTDWSGSAGGSIGDTSAAFPRSTMDRGSARL